MEKEFIKFLYNEFGDEAKVLYEKECSYNGDNFVLTDTGRKIFSWFESYLLKSKGDNE